MFQVGVGFPRAFSALFWEGQICSAQRSSSAPSASTFRAGCRQAGVGVEFRGGAVCYRRSCPLRGRLLCTINKKKHIIYIYIYISYVCVYIYIYMLKGHPRVNPLQRSPPTSPHPQIITDMKVARGPMNFRLSLFPCKLPLARQVPCGTSLPSGGVSSTAPPLGGSQAFCPLGVKHLAGDLKTDSPALTGMPIPRVSSTDFNLGKRESRLEQRVVK